MSRILGDLSEGTLVYIDETINGVTDHIPYIYLGIDEYDNARLLRQYAALAKRMHNSNYASYNGCEADIWLENEETGFLSRFEEDIINHMVYTTIKYTDYNQTSDGSVSLESVARRCFPLSYTEEGWGATSVGSEGRSYLKALKTFYNTTNDNTARIGRQVNETTVNVWLRSGSSATYFRNVSTGGSAGGYIATNASNWLRPALSFDLSTSVSDEGAESIFLLPEGRITTWNIDATMSLGITEKQPKQCMLTIPIETFEKEQFYVCNNYGDEEPIWVSCKNNGVANFGSSKTSDNWQLGVKMYLESSVPNRKVGEPAMIVKY